VVDDEASVRRMLERWLTGLGYEVALAPHAGEASELLQSAEFALALVDIRMPGVSGMELLREIVRAHPDTAVVMCTAVVDVETAVESLKLGAYDFMGKPFDFEDVRLRVERALERRRLALENRDYRLNLEGRVEEQTRQFGTDHLYASETEVSCSRQLVEVYGRVGQSVVGIKVTPGAVIHNFGCVAGLWEEPGSLLNVTEVYEKPDLQYAREHLHVEGLEEGFFLSLFGQYVLAPRIFDYLEELTRNNVRERAELQLTSCLDRLRREEGVSGYVVKGERFDIGTPDSYRQAIIDYRMGGPRYPAEAGAAHARDSSGGGHPPNAVPHQGRHGRELRSPSQKAAH
jgi:DNA-binding response OmpR family regulator